MNDFDLKTKILVVIIFLSILVVGYLSYQRTLVRRDFEIFDSEAEVEEDVTAEDTLPVAEEGTDIIEESTASSTQENN